jgi:AAT family amino acid transporter
MRMTGSSSNFDEIAERERGLQRRLSSGQLSMIAIGGAIGTGPFLRSGFAIGIAGPSFWLCCINLSGLIWPAALSH